MAFTPLPWAQPRAVRATHRAGVLALATTTRSGFDVVDLDRFKSINDQFGHDVGDALLSAFAMRLSDCLQPSDLLCRLGGDEFAILAPRIQTHDEARELAAAFREAMRLPFELTGRTLEVSASVGIAIFRRRPNEKEIAQRRIRRYQAKSAPRIPLPAAGQPQRSA